MTILTKRKSPEGEVLRKEHVTTDNTTKNEIFGKIRINGHGNSRVLIERN
jgi:hypothetical protein